MKKCVYIIAWFLSFDQFILSFEKLMFNLCVFYLNLIFWYVLSAMIDITLFNLDTVVDYIGICLYAGLLLSLVSLKFQRQHKLL